MIKNQLHERVLFGSLTGQIDNFDHGHKGGISQTLAQLDDAGIAALAFRAKRSDFIKQPLNGGRIMNGGGSQAAGMHVTALGKRNQLFHIGAQGLGLGQGGGDASIEDEAACLVGEPVSYTHLN